MSYILKCEGDLAFIAALDEMPADARDLLAWTTLPHWLESDLQAEPEGYPREPQGRSARSYLLPAAVAERAGQLGLPRQRDVLEHHERCVREHMSRDPGQHLSFERYWEGVVAADMPPPPPFEAFLSRGQGRNEPCWCGSGKKFKLCHGH